MAIAHQREGALVTTLSLGLIVISVHTLEFSLIAFVCLPIIINNNIIINHNHLIYLFVAYNSANGHSYFYVSTPTAYQNAYINAYSNYGYPLILIIAVVSLFRISVLIYHTTGAYLATITSGTENMYVLNTFHQSNYWIGGCDYAVIGACVDLYLLIILIFALLGSGSWGYPGGPEKPLIFYHVDYGCIDNLYLPSSSPFYFILTCKGIAISQKTHLQYVHKWEYWSMQADTGYLLLFLPLLDTWLSMGVRLFRIFVNSSSLFNYLLRVSYY